MYIPANMLYVCLVYGKDNEACQNGLSYRHFRIMYITVGSRVSV